MTVALTRPDRETVTVTIANGASQSGVIPLAGRRIRAIHTPAAWTTAALTFLAAETPSATYDPVYDDGGTEVSVAQANVVADRAIVNATILAKLDGLGFVKLRSGTAGAAVNQGADRVFVLTLTG